MPYTAMRNLAGGDLVAEYDMDALRQNLDYLHLPSVVSAMGSAQLTTSTTFGDLVGASATLTAYGGITTIWLKAYWHPGGLNPYGFFGINVDGSLVASANSAGSTVYGDIDILFATALASGTHMIKGVWRQSIVGGTGICSASYLMAWGG